MYLACTDCYFNLSRLSNFTSTDDVYEYDVLPPLDRVNLKFVSEIYTLQKKTRTQNWQQICMLQTVLLSSSFNFIIVRLL